MSKLSLRDITIALESLREDSKNKNAYNPEKKKTILNTILSEHTSKERFFLKPIFAGSFGIVLIAIISVLVFKMPYTGIKGNDNINSILLTAQYGEDTIEGFVEDNMVLTKTKNILFTFTLKNPGYVYVFYQVAGKPKSQIYSELLTSGEHRIMVDGRTVAFPLSEIPLEQAKTNVTFCAVYSKTKLNELPKNEDESSCIGIVVTH